MEALCVLRKAICSITLTTSSMLLEPGGHTFTVTAIDDVGNTTERTVAFATPVEQPEIELTAPSDGATVEGSVELNATVTADAFWGSSPSAVGVHAVPKKCLQCLQCRHFSEARHRLLKQSNVPAPGRCVAVGERASRCLDAWLRKGAR